MTAGKQQHQGPWDEEVVEEEDISKVLSLLMVLEPRQELNSSSNNHNSLIGKGKMSRRGFQSAINQEGMCKEHPRGMDLSNPTGRVRRGAFSLEDLKEVLCPRAIMFTTMVMVIRFSQELVDHKGLMEVGTGKGVEMRGISITIITTLLRHSSSSKALLQRTLMIRPRSRRGRGNRVPLLWLLPWLLAGPAHAAAMHPVDAKKLAAIPFLVFLVRWSF